MGGWQEAGVALASLFNWQGGSRAGTSTLRDSWLRKERGNTRDEERRRKGRGEELRKDEWQVVWWGFGSSWAWKLKETL